jgi:hypothetical protein
VIWVSTNSGTSFGSPVEVTGGGTGTAITNALHINGVLYLNKTDTWFSTTNYSSFTRVAFNCAPIKFSFGMSQDSMAAQTGGGTTEGVSIGVQGTNGVPNACRVGIISSGRQFLLFDTSKTGERYVTGLAALRAEGETGGRVAMRIR